MSGKDKNVKKLVTITVKTQSEINTREAATEKPTEKVRKYFKRKAYGKYE